MTRKTLSITACVEDQLSFNRRALAWSIAGLFAFAAICSVVFAPYFLAKELDRRCFLTPALPRAAINECMTLSIQGECQQSERLENARYRLGRCVDYRVLGTEPIHVIFDDNNLAVAHISAYE